MSALPPVAALHRRLVQLGFLAMRLRVDGLELQAEGDTAGVDAASDVVDRREADILPFTAVNSAVLDKSDEATAGAS